MKTSKIFLSGVILIMLGWVIYLFQSFLLAISIGVLIAVSTAGLNEKILKFTKNRQIVSAVLTTLILCALFFVPFIYAIAEIAKSLANIDMALLDKTLSYIKNYEFSLPNFAKNFEPDIKSFIANLNFEGIIKQILSYASGIAKSSANFALQMFLIIIFYFFTNLYGRDILNFFKKSIPIAENELDYMFKQTSNTMSVVFYSTILNAVLQGFLFSIIAAIYGFDMIFFAILYAFCSLIPIIGGALCWAPLGLYELANGNFSAAVVISLYSIIVISTIADNFIKPVIIRFINSKLVDNPAKINEILIFFAMLAGIGTFGFWGMILGPAILTLFVSVLNLYVDFSNKTEHRKTKH